VAAEAGIHLMSSHQIDLFEERFDKADLRGRMMASPTFLPNF